MRRYNLTFEYDGREFSGWQKQPDARTVEGVIEKAFSTLYQQEIDIVGQGRTDAGVHALGQTAHAELPDLYDTGRILHAMKGLLPDDAALLNIEPVPPGFHARFDAVSRSYWYQIMTRPSPLMRHYSWYVYSELDEKKLHQCAKMVEGEHDFVNFCIPSGDEFMTTICTITESRWEKEGEILVYNITGNRFLRHMVRRLVGTMIKVAEGSLFVSEFQELLHQEEATQKGHTAPAHGLFLENVNYN